MTDIAGEEIFDVYQFLFEMCEEGEGEMVRYIVEEERVDIRQRRKRVFGRKKIKKGRARGTGANETKVWARYVPTKMDLGEGGEREGEGREEKG